MRKLLFLWAFFPLASFAASPSLSPVATDLPSELQKDGVSLIIKNASFKNWRVLIGSHYASLNWNQDNLSRLSLYITPSAHMITIDMIARKSAYREFKLPFITWNIKEVSVILNKSKDKNGWVTYTTTVYTDKIDRLVNALKDNSPMTLTLSTLTTIPVTLDGLQPALSAFTDTIRQKKLQAPYILSLQKDTNDTTLPPNGMEPSLFPLFHQTDMYIRKCISLSSEPLEHSERNRVCMKRNDYLKQMQDKGWCWGSGDSDQHDKDKNWRLCIFNPKGGVQKLKEKVRDDLKKAESITKG